MRLGWATLGSLILATAAHAQTPYQPPRLADGHPDFGGVWTTAFITRVERPEGVAYLEATPAQERELVAAEFSGRADLDDPDTAFLGIRALAKVRGALRTSLVVEPEDGRIPYSERALAMAQRADQLFVGGYDNPEERDNSERCLSGAGQPPIRVIPVMFPFQIVQSPGGTLIATEDPGQARVVHFTGSPPNDGFNARDGWSEGSWQGDTLVVVTTHHSANDPYRSTFGRPIIVGPGSRIVERFTRLSDTELLYQYTVEDSLLYTRPWLAEFSMALNDAEAVLEYACHEGNYTMVNVLKAGREAERRAGLAGR
jgi:hypothetical protein